MSRPFDLVLFGATGFTGALVAEYLAKRKRPGLRWALAGRNKAKLEGVRAEIAKLDPTLAELPILQADATSSRELRAIADQTGLVITTVGPYHQHGFPLAEACAQAGTDYCDLTGEVPFVRRVADELAVRAAETGARLVPCSGFDSIPSDLGVFLLSEHFQKQGKRLARAKLVVGRAKGGMSGGTVASMLGLMDAAGKDRKIRSLLGDPYGLNPDRKNQRGPDGSDPMGLSRDRDLGTWTAPFVMAAINTRVVRRTNALLEYPYGKDFRYEEVMGMGRGAGGFVRAAGLTAGLGAFLALAVPKPTRGLLGRALPTPGQGPDREAREKGFFEIDVLGWAQGDDRPSAVCHIRGNADPGYGETAKMLSEVGLLLVDTRGKEGKKGGVWTPASAMGSELAERLRAANMTWDVSSR